MWKDPIIDEIHKLREKYLKHFNYDLHEVCNDLRTKQEQNGRTVVAPKPRPAKRTSKTA